MSQIRLMPVVLTGLFATPGAFAHHAANGIYDVNDMGEIDGEITSMSWRNPHVRFEVIRVGESGVEETWRIEFGSVNTLERLGMSRDAVAVGDRLRISGLMGRVDRQSMFAQSITLASGEVLTTQGGRGGRYGITEESLRAARNVDEELRADIFRVWLPQERPHTGVGTTVYPLTAAGRAGQSEWDPANDPALRCEPPGLPTAMDNPYPIEFVDDGEAITLRLEEWDGVRTIYMNGAAGDPVQPRMGRSVGRWEGETLVVRTTDIGWRYVDDLGTPQSEDVVIDERFTPSDDGTSLAWEARITDPVNFTEPVVQEGLWVWLPGHEVKPYNCALPEPR